MKILLMIFKVVVVSIFIFLTGCKKKQTSPSNAERWKQVASLNVDVWEGQSFCVNSKAYLLVGNAFYVFDQTTDQWTQKADFPGAFRNHGATSFSIGPKGYYGMGRFMGVDRTTYLNDFWEYDPSKDQWTRKADFPLDSIFEAKGITIGTKGFVVAAQIGNNNYFNHFFQYDPTTNFWSAKSDFPGSFRASLLGFGTTVKGYFGMGNDRGLGINDLWEYNPANDQWTRKADFPTKFIPELFFNLGGKGYTCGGFYLNGTGGTYVPDLYQYDPENNQWTRKTDFPGYVRALKIGFSIGNKGYTGLGYSINGSSAAFFHDFWEYTP